MPKDGASAPPNHKGRIHKKQCMRQPREIAAARTSAEPLGTRVDLELADQVGVLTVARNRRAARKTQAERLAVVEPLYPVRLPPAQELIHPRVPSASPPLATTPGKFVDVGKLKRLGNVKSRHGPL